MLSNKKLVLDDGQKKQWQPQRQVHVEKKQEQLVLLSNTISYKIKKFPELCLCVWLCMSTSSK